MKYFKLKAISKNKEALIYFYNYLFLRKDDLKLNFYMLKKNFKSSNSNKRVTILTAPHVYKTAQEQFAVSYYQEQYLIQTTNSRKFLKFIKKLKFEKFSNLTILLKHYIIKNNYRFYENLTLLNYGLLMFSTKKVNHFLYLKKKVVGRYNLLENTMYLFKTDFLKEYKTELNIKIVV